MQVWLSVLALSLCTVVSGNDCDTDLSMLEQALFETGNNLFELNRVFYPPSLLTTRFIRVNYTFVNEETEADTCTNVTYIWAVGAVLFLQPPQFNSLFFYYPNNELETLSLQLPIECIGLINGTDAVCSCEHDSHMLDILTQQVVTVIADPSQLEGQQVLASDGGGAATAQCGMKCGIIWHGMWLMECGCGMECGRSRMWLQHNIILA